eukprot:g35801.t1
MFLSMALGLYALCSVRLRGRGLRCQEQQRRVRHHSRRLIRSINYPWQRVYQQRMSFEMMSEELCVRQLRFNKEAIGRLCDILQGDLRPSSKCRTALSVAMKVTTALNFYACGSYQASVGHMCKITQSAARACIHQVTDAIFRKASNFIRFDMSPVELRGRAVRFHRIAGFPKVLGVIAGSHIQLKAPNDQPISYMNSRGFHSLNVMIVCDAQMRILAVNADHKGSADDAFVLENSSLAQFMNKCPQRSGWLLGSSSYPLKTWLMVPYSKTQSKAQQRKGIPKTVNPLLADHFLMDLWSKVFFFTNFPTT